MLRPHNPLATDAQTRMSFDAWGLRRNATTLNDDIDLGTLLEQVITTTTRGYTGHEMLDVVGLIHMNGRVYDPLLGRFLSADPFIQAPSETQSFNRYAYVWNNPMSSTDPSGYWNNKEIWGKVGGVFQIIGSILMSNPLTFAIGASLYVIGGFGVGESMDNGARGAFTAAAMIGVNYAFMGPGEGLAQGAAGTISGTSFMATAAQIGAYVAVHPAIGGMLAQAQGGSFWKGAAASGLSAFARGVLPTQGGAGFMVSVVVGGTTSRITGGKFANGAITGGFAYAMSAAARSGSKGLHGGSGKGGSADAAAVEAELNELRKHPEFAALEEKYGKFNLTIDKSLESSQYDPSTHTIRFQPGDLNLECGVEMHAGYEGSLSGVSDEAYWNAVDNYPKWNRFSIKRILFHEGLHATQDASGFRYQLNKPGYENPVIQRTNNFMYKNFGEPHRVLDHNKVRIP